MRKSFFSPFSCTGFLPLAIHGLLASLLIPNASHAQSLDEAINLEEILPETVSSPLINTLGALFAHRPFQGASSLTYTSPDAIPSDGKQPFQLGLRVELETTLMGVPADVTVPTGTDEPGESLADSLPSVPMLRLMVKKSITPNLDFAVSGLYYQRSFFGGLSAKLLIAAPEEGLHWAIRGTYSRTSLDFETLGLPSVEIPVGEITTATANLKLLTEQYSGELVASRKLSFAEPYFGVGILSSKGQLKVPIEITDLDYSSELATAIAINQGYYAFTGVSFFFPALGTTLGVEGSYSSLSMHSLGILLGFRI